MKGGVTISAIGHGVVLLWALVSIARPLDVKPADSMPVDIISADEFSKMVAGAKNAPKAEAPKPLVEKVAEAQPVEDPAAKVAKTEVKAAVETPPMPEEKPQPPEPKPPAAAPPQPKAEAKAPDKKEPEQKIDPIAAALKKEEAKKPEKKAESKPQPLPPKPAPQPPKYDPRQVQALLDKRDAKRVASAGQEINTTPNLGYVRGAAAQLSQSEIDAFKYRVRYCWRMPPGTPADMRTVLHVIFRPDGFVEASSVVGGTNTVQAATMGESARRALLQCQPYTMLKPEHYDSVPMGWKDMVITFVAEDFM
jgi:colicin import membrane protein